MIPFALIFGAVVLGLSIEGAAKTIANAIRDRAQDHNGEELT